MSVLNKNYKQVVNLAGQVSELNTAGLECVTLKTSSLLANSVIPRLSNGVVKSVHYSLTTTGSALPSTINSVVDLTGGDEPSTNAVILSASMKSTGTISSGDIKLTVGLVDIISLNGTSVDATVVNTGGVLGEQVSDIPGGVITVTYSSGNDGVTVSGTVTYFEPN